MSLRLACDLDGVLADMESELIRQAKILFGDAALHPPHTRVRRSAPHRPAPPDAPAPIPDVPPVLQLTVRQERQLWRHVTAIEGFWESLEEIEPGSVARLAALAHERRWEVIFLTRRPQSAGQTAQVQTQRWLEAKGFPLASVFVVQGSRGRIAAALGLDVVIDDRLENCIDVVTDSHARALLVWRGERKNALAAAKRPGIQLVKSFDECLTGLSELGSSGRGRSGLVGRMMRRLGLKETAGG